MRTVRAVSGRQTRLVLSPSEKFDQLVAAATPWKAAEATNLVLTLEDETFTVTIQFKVAQLKKQSDRGMNKVCLVDATDGANRCTLAHIGYEWRLIFASTAEIADKS